MEKYACFFFPVINGKLYVGQRGTMPHQGKYGPIGGKAEITPGDLNQTHLITKLDGTQVISIADRLAHSQGREFPKQTAVREFNEEVFGGTLNLEDITDHYKLGYVVDSTSGTDYVCYVHLGRVQRTDFRTPSREILDFRPLSEVDSSALFPLARIALGHIRFLSEHRLFVPEVDVYNKLKLHQQIGPLEISVMETNLFGAYIYRV